MIIAPNRYDPIAQGNGEPEQRFIDFLEDVATEINNLVARPVREITADTTLVLEDGGTVIRNVGSSNIVVTIPASTYDVGAEIEFQNDGSGTMKIAIDTDTLTSSADGTTGTRTIAAAGEARTLLVAETQWKIRGEQMT